MTQTIKRFALFFALVVGAYAQGYPITNKVGTWTSSNISTDVLGVDTLGFNTATVTFVPSGTLSAGTVTFEASDTSNATLTDNWFSLACAAPTTNSSTFTPVSGSNAAIQCNIVGFKRFRVRNSTPITGTGQYLINVQAANGYTPPSNQPVSSTTSIGTVTPATYGTAINNQQNVTGSAVALATNTAQQVCVEALSTNAISVFIGGSGVTTGNGYELPPGATVCPMVNNTNLLFVIASTTGASVSWIAVR